MAAARAAGLRRLDSRWRRIWSLVWLGVRVRPGLVPARDTAKGVPNPRPRSVPEHRCAAARRDPRIGRQEGDAQTDRGARDQTIVRVRERSERSRCLHVAPREPLDAKPADALQAVAPRREAGRKRHPPGGVEQRDLPERDRRDDDLQGGAIGAVQGLAGAPADPARVAGEEPQERVRVGDEALQRRVRRRAAGRAGNARALPTRARRRRMTSTSLPAGRFRRTSSTGGMAWPRLRLRSRGSVLTMLTLGRPRTVTSMRPPSRATRSTISGSRFLASLTPSRCTFMYRP